jgi:hypothetical protein
MTGGCAANHPPHHGNGVTVHTDRHAETAGPAAPCPPKGRGCCVRTTRAGRAGGLARRRAGQLFSSRPCATIA